MKTVDFYELPAEVADRLRWGMRGQFDPKPLLYQPATPSIVGWLSLSFGAAALLIAVWLVGYGQLGAGLARQPTAMILAYVVLVALFAWGVIEVIAERARRLRLPFAPGFYLFGARLIDARRRKLVVFPIEEALEVAPRGQSALVMRFEGHEFLFRVAPAHLERALEIVRRAREHAKRGLGRASRIELDPLEAPAVAMPLPPSEAPVKPPPRWPRFAPLFGAALGLSGVGLFFVRDRLSDERMFARAVSRDEVAAYETYLAEGDAHRDEVARKLLPRAALRPAVAAGTVGAIDDFIRAYPDHDIAPEVEKARRAAVAAAFERARAQGSLTSLASFAEAHPDHHLDGAYRAAMKSIYKRALEEVRGKMPPSAGRQRELVGELLAWAERVGPRPGKDGLRGPAVLVRMRQVPSKGMDRADKLVRINPYYAGDRSLPSSHVERSDLTPLEKDAATSIANKLAAPFRPELITFAEGPSLEGEVGELDVPTFVVDYRIEPSGQNYASRKPRGIFFGVVVFSSIHLHLPGKGEAFESGAVLTERIPVDLIESHEGGGAVEEVVYRTMIERAFAELEKRYLGDWFVPPT